MKKNLIIFTILILFLIPFTIAQTGTLDDAKACLNNKIQDCTGLNPEQKAFSSMAISKCTDELIADAKNEECWPKENCDVKTTAQAIIALDQAGNDANKAEKWLISQTAKPTGLEWYLQIDSPSSTKCKITYGNEYNIEIEENKKIDSNAGSCLTLSQGNYWLKVSPNCYDTNFSIQCDKSFRTSLLYKKISSSELIVPGKSNSESANGKTQERVKSLCFSDTTSCDYEATLWAVLALDIKRETSYFIPYLISEADENEQYLPDSFLYLYSSTKNENFKTNLLAKQKESSYWDESGQRNYDTAVALLALQRETDPEKTSAKTWLLENQDSDGCWGGVRDTAFLIFSGWGQRKTPIVIPELKSCSELGGERCDSDETCNGVTQSSTDGECCMRECEKSIVSKKSDCERYGGTCKSSCDRNEKEEDDDCDVGVCCKEKEPSDVNYTLVWILVILIILVVIAILFRNKLRDLFSKGKGSPPAPGQPRGPGFPPTSMPQMPTQRRILPQRQAQQSQLRPSVDKEFNEVLEKLKKMGK